jgi:hypothetical protein
MTEAVDERQFGVLARTDDYDQIRKCIVFDMDFLVEGKSGYRRCYIRCMATECTGEGAGRSLGNRNQHEKKPMGVQATSLAKSYWSAIMAREIAFTFSKRN